MAEGASIAPHVETIEAALVQSLEHMVEHNQLPPDQGHALISAIQNNHTAEAEVLYADLFSGSTDNSHRLFELTQNALSGGGHSVATNSSAASMSQEQREQQRAADRIWQQLSLDQLIRNTQREIAELDRKIEALEKKIEEDRRTLTGFRTQHSALADDVDRLQRRNDRIDNVELQAARESIRQAERNWDQVIARSPLSQEGKKALANLGELGDRLVTVRITLPGDETSRKHVVYKDEQGQYYVEDGAGNRHTITDAAQLRSIQWQETKGESFGDHNNPEIENLVRQYDTEWDTYLAEVQKLPSQVRQAIISAANNNEQARSAYWELVAEYRENERNITQKQGQMADLDRQIADLESSIERDEVELARLRADRAEAQLRLEGYQHARTGYETRATAMRTTADESNRNYAALLEYMDTPKYAEYLAGRMPLEEALEGAPENVRDIFIEREEAVAAQTQAAAISTAVAQEVEQTQGHILRYSDRHQQLQTLYGGGGLSHLSWAVNPTTAGILSFVRPHSNVVEAWNNPLTYTNAQGVTLPVYRNNDTGRLYTLNETTQARAYFGDADPRAESQINSRAAVGELFMNETPNSKDKNNTFSQTRQAILDSSRLATAAGVPANIASANATTATARVGAVDAELRAHGIDPARLTPAPAAGASAPRPNPVMPAARHEDAGRMSRMFSEIAADRRPLDNQNRAQLESTIRQDPVITNALRLVNIDIERFMDNPVEVDRFADRLEESMRKGEGDYSKQIAELRELQERLAGHQVVTPAASAAPITAGTGR